MLKLSQVFGWVNASQTFGSGAIDIKRVHTDTRSLQAGDLFVALKGETFDANTFLAQAKELGAVAAIAQAGLSSVGLPGLEVVDSRLALGELAAGWRAQFDLPLIAVTGSNGKTTVTQMIASVLAAFKHDNAFATQGNLNNDIGVPLTLLRLTGIHQIAVVELGMNHPGEIAHLSQIVKPSVALVNNAQREHLEFMGTVEAVARENGSVIASLGSTGTAVFPADDVYTSVWQQMAGARKILTFALEGDADVTAKAQWTGQCWQVKAQTPAGPIGFALHIAGLHNVKNALAATACALAAGVPPSVIASGLSEFTPVKGRSRAVNVHCFGRDITLIDDTYNANPDSMDAAIDLLAELPAPQLLVMGDMGEVGTQGPQFHAEAGKHAQSKGIDNLFSLGEQAALASENFKGGRHFEDIGSLNQALVAQLTTAGSVLIKGSRFMKMERAVAAVTDYEKSVGHEAQQVKQEQQIEQEKRDNSHAA
jgi:UDP-N-acetylmuramoyl-tripeptide--D-alanyl-D-alanine ligase